ncbi:hypothetical protein [Sulfurovum sp. NBC37-1]|uniref:hypothetical protein n=1 Tax=Sulfurovum sp. (strain NBC37-1) TaxID=387093 RepID=UPI0011D0E292|nr:hypothetical protein [Sulfurovum sp. NBC37-1]
MNRIMIAFFMGVFFVSSLHAQDERSRVQGEILNSFAEVVKARTEAIQTLKETVAQIEAERAHRGEENLSSDGIQTRIAETKSVAQIAQSVAKVEISKIDAKEKIVLSVDEMAKKQASAIDEQALKKEKLKAMKNIANAISQVEVQKAKATQNIILATGNVERSRMQPEPKVVDEEATLSVAKSHAAVKIARSVSAVEIRQAVSKAELVKALPKKDIEVLLQMRREDVSLEEIKAKARAAIARAAAKVEVARAAALSEIAKTVAAVEIAQFLDTYEQTREDQKLQGLPSSYPKELIYFKNR